LLSSINNKQFKGRISYVAMIFSGENQRHVNFDIYIL